MSRSHWSGRAYIGFPFACSSNPLIGSAEKYSISQKGLAIDSTSGILSA